MGKLITGKKIEAISRTNFGEEELVCNGKPVNRQILEAITSIPYVKVFGFGEVQYQESIKFKSMEGYVYQRDAEEEDFEILITYDDDAKKFMVFAEKDVKEDYIFQALLLADMDVNFSGTFGDLNDAYSIIPQDFLHEGHENWAIIAEYVQKIEENLSLFEENVTIDRKFFDKKNPSVADGVEDLILEYTENAEMDGEAEEAEEAATDMDEQDVEVEEIDTDAEAEEVDTETDAEVDIMSELNLDTLSRTETGEVDYKNLDTRNLFLYLVDYAGVQPKDVIEISGVSQTVVYNFRSGKKIPSTKTQNKIKLGLMKIIESPEFKEQQELLAKSKPAAVAKPAVTLQHPQVQRPQALQDIAPLVKKSSFTEEVVRAKRRLVWDSLRKRVYLKKFNTEKTVYFDDALIDRVMRVEAYNRDRVVELGLEVVMDIPDKMEYMGDAFPLRVAISTILAGRHLAVSGPSGCGKSTLINTVAALFNLPLYKVDGNNSVGPDSYLGQRTFDENNNIIVLDGMLVKAMQNGGIFYFDEMNMTRGSSVSKTNGALDKQRSILNELKAQRLDASPDFRCFVSFNPDYEDTNPINKATNDRVERLTMQYMSSEHLEQFVYRLDNLTDYQKNVLGMKPVDREYSNILIQIAQILQDKKSNLPSETASLRNIEAMYEHLAAGVLTFSEVGKIIIDKYPDHKVKIMTVLQGVEKLEIKDGQIGAGVAMY